MMPELDRANAFTQKYVTSTGVEVFLHTWRGLKYFCIFEGVEDFLHVADQVFKSACKMFIYGLIIKIESFTESWYNVQYFHTRMKIGSEY